MPGIVYRSQRACPVLRPEKTNSRDTGGEFQKVTDQQFNITILRGIFPKGFLSAVPPFSSLGSKQLTD
jgi:hypothetical protein